MPEVVRRGERKLPRYWLQYVIVLVVFTGMIGFLIYLGVDPLVAIGVPATLSMVADSVLVRLATLNQAVSPTNAGSKVSGTTALAPADSISTQEEPATESLRSASETGSEVV